MKKSKWLRIVLAIAVLGIWGSVIVRLLARDEMPETATASPLLPKKKKHNPVTEDYKLIADYRDPFEQEIFYETTEPEENVPEVPEVVVPPAPFAWPDIKFHGTLRNPSRKVSLLMISYNGKDHLVKTGDRIGEIKILKAWRDSVRISGGNEEKTFYK